MLLIFEPFVGVVISIVSALGGDGYALVLDAATFQEIARVKFPYGLPYVFHGCWIPDKIIPDRFDGNAQVD